jgi:hypothetical protein
MKRAWSIFLSILLGATGVGVGTGYFLHLANQDRRLLAQETLTAKQAAQKALEDQQAAIQETNLKLAQANTEVEKAQYAIRALEREHAMLAQAVPLVPPTAAATRGWISAMSAPLGISLRYPPGSAVTGNDEIGLTIAASSTDGNSSLADSPWVFVSRYDAPTERRYTERLVSSTPAVYLVRGRLLAGTEGYLPDEGNPTVRAAALSVVSDGTSTHLLWIQAPPKVPTVKKNPVSPTIEDILSTLEFQQ